MKTLLCLILLLALMAAPVAYPQRILVPILAGSPRCNIALVAGQSVGRSASPIALPSNPTTGNLVVLVMGSGDSGATNPTTILDANLNSYTLTASSPTAGAIPLWIAYLASAPANADKTISIVGGSPASFWIAEFSKAGGFTFDTDVENNGGNAGTTINLPSITPTQNCELLIGTAYGSGGNLTSVNSPWSIIGSLFFQFGVEYHVKTSAAAQAISFTQPSGDWNAIAAAFK